MPERYFLCVYDLIAAKCLWDERNTRTNPLAISMIIIAKELDQILFLVCTKSQQKAIAILKSERQILTIDPILEKEPQNNRIAHETNLVSDHNLRAHRKEEIAKVTRMAKISIQSFGHQHVVVFLALGRDVVETDARLRHGDAADDLSGNHQHCSCSDGIDIGVGILKLGEEEGSNDDFGHRSHVSGKIGSSVRRQQVARHLSIVRVVSRRRPEFQEMEEGKGCDELRKAPDAV